MFQSLFPRFPVLSNFPLLFPLSTLPVICHSRSGLFSQFFSFHFPLYFFFTPLYYSFHPSPPVPLPNIFCFLFSSMTPSNVPSLLRCRFYRAMLCIRGTSHGASISSPIILSSSFSFSVLFPLIIHSFLPLPYLYPISHTYSLFFSGSWHPLTFPFSCPFVYLQGRDTFRLAWHLPSLPVHGTRPIGNESVPILLAQC